MMQEEYAPGRLSAIRRAAYKAPKCLPPSYAKTSFEVVKLCYGDAVCFNEYRRAVARRRAVYLPLLPRALFGQYRPVTGVPHSRHARA